MGTTPSSLTTHTLSALKKFNIFDVFPDDRSDADALIAKEATNALKYVNSNFASRLGGHRKRKKIDSFPTGMSPNFVTPKRRSRRVISTPDSTRLLSIDPASSPISLGEKSITPISTSRDHPSMLSVIDMDTYPSLPIHSSSISYRVLLPHDIFRLEDGSDVVLVLDKNSNGFEKNINQYLEDHVLHIHSREQEGSVKYEFMMKIGAFSTCDRVLDGSINDAEQVLRYNQGDGLTYCVLTSVSPSP